MRHPGFAEAQVTDGDPKPDQEAAQTRGVVEELVDLLIADECREKGQSTDGAGGESGSAGTPRALSRPNIRGALPLCAMAYSMREATYIEELPQESTADRITAFIRLAA